MLVRSDAGIHRRSCRAAIRYVRMVRASNGVEIEFGMPEVEEMYDVGVVAHADGEVLGLDVHYKQATAVHIFDSSKLSESNRSVSTPRHNNLKK